MRGLVLFAELQRDSDVTYLFSMLIFREIMSFFLCVCVCDSQAEAAGQDGRVLPVNIWRRITD